MEFIKILQWFNPFIYLFDRSLRAVHEYQADEECINSGIPLRTYQGLMLDQVFKTNIFSASSRFSNSSLTKKRLIMMSRKRSRTLANLKLLMALPVIAFLLLLIPTCSKNSFEPYSANEILTGQQSREEPRVDELSKELAAEKEDDAFVVVEEMPVFPGGEIALLRYIAENTSYPGEAKAKGAQGRVIVRFKIMPDGKVTDASVIRAVDPSLDAEALRVIGSLPEFEPGKQGGVPVPVWYMVPISFTLTDQIVTPPPPPPPPSAPAANANVSGPGEPFVVVEEMPMFPGGEAALLQYLADNVKYPGQARAKNISGKVIIRFCVNEKGVVDRLSVLKGVDPELDAEAIRVVSSLPAFTPGKQGGVPVPVW